NSGMAALAMAIVMGKRKGYGKKAMFPHNIPLTLVGVGLLWIGWFGFNAGSAMKANESASMAFLATQLATAAAVICWVFTEWAVKGKPTILGMASGAVSGLVAITPAAGYVSPGHAVVIGALAGVLCYFGVLAKQWIGYDDSLDVFGIHAVGGAFGSLATGFFASKAIGGTDGWLYGNAAQMGSQVTAVLAIGAFSFFATFIIASIMNLVMYLRVPEEDELTGTDTAIHGEAGYNL
ncbi:MAG: ammonium transporter, partial [Desulfomonile tiedjei]|nr:ammonium transporter [Desulfomonile tiedjei]